MAEGIYKYRKEKPKKVYTKPQIGFGSVGYASDKKKKYEKPSVRVKPNKEVLKERDTEKHNIDVDLTPAQLSATRKFENRVHKLKTERVALIDKNGKIISQSTSGSNKRTQLRTPSGMKYPMPSLPTTTPIRMVMGQKDWRGVSARLFLEQTYVPQFTSMPRALGQSLTATPSS